MRSFRLEAERGAAGGGASDGRWRTRGVGQRTGAAGGWTAPHRPDDSRRRQRGRLGERRRRRQRHQRQGVTGRAEPWHRLGRYRRLLAAQMNDAQAAFGRADLDRKTRAVEGVQAMRGRDAALNKQHAGKQEPQSGSDAMHHRRALPHCIRARQGDARSHHGACPGPAPAWPRKNRPAEGAGREWNGAILGRRRGNGSGRPGTIAPRGEAARRTDSMQQRWSAWWPRRRQGGLVDWLARQTKPRRSEGSGELRQQPDHAWHEPGRQPLGNGPLRPPRLACLKGRERDEQQALVARQAGRSGCVRGDRTARGDADQAERGGKPRHCRGGQAGARKHQAETGSGPSRVEPTPNRGQNELGGGRQRGRIGMAKSISAGAHRHLRTILNRGAEEGGRSPLLWLGRLSASRRAA